MIESIPVTDPVKLHSQMRDGSPTHLVNVRSPAAGFQHCVQDAPEPRRG